MDIPRLTHVRLNVRDLPAAIAWYSRVLGVAAEGHWPPGAPTYVHFTLGPAQLALGRYDPAPALGRGSISRSTTSRPGGPGGRRP